MGPEYTIRGGEVVVRFTALESARVTDRVTDKVTDKQHEKDNMLLKYIAENPRATYKDIAEYMGVSRKTAADRIKKLKDANLIFREESDRKAAWKLADRRE